MEIFLQTVQKIIFDKNREEEFIELFKLNGNNGYDKSSEYYEYEMKTSCYFCGNVQLFDVTEYIQNLIETKDDLFIQS